MSERTLNTPQVAALLVATSCGIGFLFGTGELAVHEGMAGSLYALATALGLAMLALCAPVLWRNGRSIWSRFDQLYGPSVSRSVALLSLIWMTGALAAQIRGGSAVLVLTGIPDTAALPLISGILIGLSFVRLSWLSAGLAICMLGCGVILSDVLLKTGGLGIWLHAPVLFVGALRHTALEHTGFSAAAVVAMVICGADYQQFVIAADSPAVARTGCLFAAGFVAVLGFLPASAVIAAHSYWNLNNVTDPVQVVPALLMHNLPSSISPNFVIAMLIASALGAGCSILRAMSDALTTAGPRSIRHSIWSRILPVVVSSFVATRGQSLVDMMIELNVVYLAAVGPLLVLRLLRVHVSDVAANASMATGCGVAMTCYLLRCTGIVMLPEAAPVLLSLPTAIALTAVLHHHTTSSSGTPERATRKPRLMLTSPRRLPLPYRAKVTGPKSGGHDASPFR